MNMKINDNQEYEMYNDISNLKPITALNSDYIRPETLSL